MDDDKKNWLNKYRHIRWGSVRWDQCRYYVHGDILQTTYDFIYCLMLLRLPKLLGEKKEKERKKKNRTQSSKPMNNNKLMCAEW